MIFIGHFTLDEKGKEGEPRHGYLTCLVESENADVAVDKFKQLLIDIQSNEDSAVGWKAAYIEDIIEMPSIPAHAIITRYQSSAGVFPKSISHTLPLADSPDRVAYGYIKDIERLEQDGENQYSEMTPFIVF